MGYCLYGISKIKKLFLIDTKWKIGFNNLITIGQYHKLRKTSVNQV